MKPKTPRQALLDSGSSHIMMPEEDFAQLKDYLIQSGQSCDHDSERDNQFYCSCVTQSYGSFPDLELIIH
jgi:hypothetical protein